MANGRVITGYSHPVYSIHSDGTRTAKALARGVSSSVEPEFADSVNLYTDNGIAETYGGSFSGGTLTLTVDGLLDATENDIFGITAATNGWTNYSKNDDAPYVSVGYVVRYMEDGVTSYVPFILNKCRFTHKGTSANTQAESIEFQTQELSATIFSNDSGIWKMRGAAETTEAAAITALETAIITA